MIPPLKYHDAHVHLSSSKLFKKIEVLRTNWRNAGVHSCQVMSMTLHESRRSLSMMKADDLYLGVGKHPWKVKKPLTEEELEEFRQLINDPNCAVIGEVGLDRYFIKDENRLKFQHETLAFFIQMAIETRKPLNVHTTGAEAELVNLLIKTGIEGNLVNIHWYNGPEQELLTLIKLGCFFSVGPAIYYSGHQKVVNKVPIDQIMTESDGDVKYKPLKLVGEPALIPMVVEKIGELTGIPFEELSEQLYQNAMKYLKVTL